MSKPKVMDFTQGHCHFVTGSQIKNSVKERLARLDRDKTNLLDQLKTQIKDIDDAVILFMTVNIISNTDPRTILTKNLSQEAARIQILMSQLELSARNVENDITYALTPADLEWYGL